MVRRAQLPRAGSHVQPFAGHSGPVLSVCLLDEGRIASAGEDGTVRVWDLASGQGVGPPFAGHSGRVLSVCALDEGRIASAGEDGMVRVWDLALGE